MNNKLVEVASFFTASDAHILRALLEAEDIEVEVFNEQFSSLTPVDSVISGGVKLWIASTDVEKAEPVIQRYYNNLKIEAVMCAQYVIPWMFVEIIVHNLRCFVMPYLVHSWVQDLIEKHHSLRDVIAVVIDGNKELKDEQ